MSVRARQRALLRLAEQIDGGTPLTENQLKWLSGVCARIGRGESADEVLGLKRERGRSDADERAREVLDMALHVVGGAIDQGMSEADAYEIGVRWQRIQHGLAPDDLDDRYSVESLRRMGRKYPEKLRPMRITGDGDCVL